MAHLSEDSIQRVVSQVLDRLATQQAPAPSYRPAPVQVAPRSVVVDGKHGVFEDASQAAAAAGVAFGPLRKAGFAGRAKIVQIVKDLCTANAETWGKLEFDETKIGRLEHKIAKLQGIANVPGVEWIQPRGMSGDHGIAMEEHTPFGVVGAITPVTHSIPTICCNIVNMVAAGNTLVINPHPGGAACAAEAVSVINQAIERELGIANVATIVRKPSLESFDAICKSDDVRLMCITGGPMVVDAAMKSGKRAICAGPGNPPVLVDSDVCMDKVANDVITGAAFDNNLLCIGEKQVFVLEKVYQQFMQALTRAGGVKLNNNQLDQLTREVFEYKGEKGGCSHAVLKRDLVGADAAKLAATVGVRAPAETPIVFAETDLQHLFVMEEQMMPMIPIIPVRSIAEGIEQARISEHGYKHSAMIHTKNVEHMTAMAQALDCTLFVKNGPCIAGLGMGGEGYASFSIATTTGEGITTPTTFTRVRRCVMVDNLKIF